MAHTNRVRVVLGGLLAGVVINIVEYVTNGVVWDSTNPNRALPDSLYLSSKPAFFGTNPWPWVDPTGATKTYTLPARARFDSLHP